MILNKNLYKRGGFYAFTKKICEDLIDAINRLAGMTDDLAKSDDTINQKIDKINEALVLKDSMELRIGDSTNDNYITSIAANTYITVRLPKIISPSISNHVRYENNGFRILKRGRYRLQASLSMIVINHGGFLTMSIMKNGQPIDRDEIQFVEGQAGSMIAEAVVDVKVNDLFTMGVYSAGARNVSIRYPSNFIIMELDS